MFVTLKVTRNSAKLTDQRGSYVFSCTVVARLLYNSVISYVVIHWVPEEGASNENCTHSSHIIVSRCSLGVVRVFNNHVKSC